MAAVLEYLESATPGSHILGTREAILLKFDVWAMEFPQQKSSHFVKEAQSYKCMKIMVNILTVWHAGFLGRGVLIFELHCNITSTVPRVNNGEESI